MGIKYYCFKSTAEEGGTGSGLNGYVYFPTTIEYQVTQALIAGDISNTATSESQLIGLTIDNGTPVVAGEIVDGFPTTLVAKAMILGFAWVADLERFESGDILDSESPSETGNIYIGNTIINSVFLGDTEVSEVYIGSTPIYIKTL